MKRKKGLGKPFPTYHFYGIHVRSQWPMPYAQCEESGPPVVELGEGSAAVLEQAREKAAGRLPNGNKWFQHYSLPDGSHYLRWGGLFEFAVSVDGRRISARALQDTPFEAFHTYLLGTLVSFSLLKLGMEPLHATVVVVDGGAVGFLGNGGYGKSSLAGIFLKAGFPLLTDDVLVATQGEQGFFAYSGPPRIKLFPEMARTLFGRQPNGVPMNPLTEKLVIPLDRHFSHGTVFPLKALYVLRPPTTGLQPKKVTIRRLSPQRAFRALVANAFNDCVVEPHRLKHHFLLMTQMASQVPVKLLSYPRILDALPTVRDAILADLAS